MGSNPRSGSQFDLLDLLFLTTAYAITLATAFAFNSRGENVPVASSIHVISYGTTLAAFLLLVRRAMTGRLNLFGEPGCGLLAQLGTAAVLNLALAICLHVIQQYGGHSIRLAHPMNWADIFYLGSTTLIVAANLAILTFAFLSSSIRWRLFFACLLAGFFIQFLDYLVLASWGTAGNVSPSVITSQFLTAMFQLFSWLPLIMLAVAIFMDHRDKLKYSWFHWFGIALYLFDYVISLVMLVLTNFLTIEQLYGSPPS